MEHPSRTAELEQRDDPAVTGRYATEGRRDQAWFVGAVVKYHRRLSTIAILVLAAVKPGRADRQPAAARLSFRAEDHGSEGGPRDSGDGCDR